MTSRRTGLPVLLATVLIGAATAIVGATSAHASPSHVALVIAGDRTVCAPWHSGVTGFDVLSSVAVIGTGSGPFTGFVTRIDGVGSASPTTSLYWSYWHDTGAGWAYSNLGPSSYHPAAGSVEGWIYNDGKAPPPSASYAAVCGALDAPTPSPAPTKAPTSAVNPPAPRPGSRSAAPPAPATKATTARTEQPAIGGTTAASARPGSPAPATKTSSVGASPTPAGTSPAPSGSARIDPVLSSVGENSTNSGAGGTLVGVGLAAAAVAALGGAALWRRRRAAEH